MLHPGDLSTMDHCDFCKTKLNLTSCPGAINSAKDYARGTNTPAIRGLNLRELNAHLLLARDSVGQRSGWCSIIFEQLKLGSHIR